MLLVCKITNTLGDKTEPVVKAMEVMVSIMHGLVNNALPPKVISKIAETEDTPYFIIPDVCYANIKINLS